MEPEEVMKAKPKRCCFICNGMGYLKPSSPRRSECVPGLVLNLIFTPEGETRAIPESLVNDLMDWCGERDLFGSVLRVDHDENGEVVDR